MNAQEKSLDQLLKQHEQQALPDLVIEPSPWQEKMSQLFQTWVEPVLSWLRTWFNGLNKINNHYQWPWKTIILTIVCMLFVVGILLVIRYFLNKKANAISNVSLANDNSEKSSLYQMYVLAKNQKNYALAARLMWKWFLQQNKIVLSTTPMEYFGRKNEVKNIYSLMFLPPAQKKDLQRFEAMLSGSNHEK
ncbi:hypothetical protein MRY82_02290 [bacterium]|nr:hypothetical protein [bacterium]